MAIGKRKRGENGLLWAGLAKIGTPYNRARGEFLRWAWRALPRIRRNDGPGG